MEHAISTSRTKGLLREQGKTQAELASYAGVYKSWISAVLSGKRNPSYELLRKIAAFLGVEVSEICEGGSAGGPEAELLEIYRGLDKAGQHRLLAAAYDIAAIGNAPQSSAADIIRNARASAQAHVKQKPTAGQQSNWLQ